ncbi:MAG: hypothetical protein FWG84_06915 [Bacteroidales bacterium]|nr:hypothetical protein [Bacteroidales bacterium]
MAILTSNMLFAQLQLSGLYSLSDDSYCDIYFTNTGRYCIMLSAHLSDDILLDVPLSDGTYSILDNDIILTDKYLHYKMQLEYKNNELHVKEAFRFLQNKVFEFRRLSDFPFIESYNISDFILQQERNIYTSQYQSAFSLKAGQYRNAGQISYFSLNLSPMGFYTLQYIIEDIIYLILSDGTWSRNGNELILYDTEVEHNFYMHIGKNKLISKLLPGDYEGITLYYKGTK